MKKLSLTLSVVLLFVLLGYFSCNDDEDPVCTNECLGCLTLDVESCECVVDLDCQCSDGIKNGNEEYIDCGGDCEDCSCDNEICWLSNDSTKTWGWAYSTLYPPAADTAFQEDPSIHTLTFYVGGTSKMVNTILPLTCYYTNSFDSVDNELLWTREALQSDHEWCKVNIKEVLVTQLGKDLFAYKLPDEDKVMYYIPIED